MSMSMSLKPRSSRCTAKWRTSRTPLTTSKMGRALAQRLGYPDHLLDRIPEGAVESFAGVGYFFDLADLKPGEAAIDLGSGSGMDILIAAGQVVRRAGSSGSTSPSSS